MCFNVVTLSPPCYHAVPCLKRASEVEAYNLNSEFALGGDDEGWVATHNDPNAAPARKGGDEAIPSIDEAAGGAANTAGAAGMDDDIPDISEMELGGADDEVRQHHC